VTTPAGQAPRGARHAAGRFLPWLAAALAAACGEARAPAPLRDGGAARGPAPSTRIELAERAGADAPGAAPDAGDIAAEVGAFDGIDRCRARLEARLAPALAEVLSDVGYHGAASDACMGVQALADRSPELCERLQVRATREGCLRRYAMFHGEPDRCPDQIEHGGREPLCVAVAMRDPSMCASELDPARVGLCRAIVLRHERPCRVAHPTAVEAQRCAGDARRWWGAVPPRRPRQSLPNGFEPSLTLCRDAAAPDAGGDGADGGPACAAIAAPVQRGIVLRPERGLVIGARAGPLVGPRLPLVELRVPLPAEGAALPATYDVAAEDVTAWVDLDPASIAPPGEAADAGVSCGAGSVTLERFEPRRGAIVAGSFDLSGCGEGEAAPRRLHGAFLTYLRDVMREAPPRRTGGSAPE
jgi:hypothetical protein